MLLSKKQVKELVLYSYAHLDRLEAAGLFPRRVRLGQNRVGWLRQEVEDWVKAKVEQRDRSR